MDLDRLIAKTLARPVPPEVSAMATHVTREFSNIEAVLAYGSCLRGVSTAESLIDLYVLTSSLATVSRNPLARLACALVPPNVYYAEMQFEGRTIRAKYAVLPLDIFERWMSADNPYFWARFSQPSALIAGHPEKVIAAISAAIATMYGNARGVSRSSDPLQVWSDGFAATYATEFRSESTLRAAELVQSSGDYFREAAMLLADVKPHPANWPLRRFTGRLWSIARLSKAAFTFTGGAAYLAWKIERHSGHKVPLRDWHHRHPILAGIVLLPRLLKKGAVR